MCDAYTEEEIAAADGSTETRVMLKLKPSLAPITAAVLPLVNKDGMPEAAEKIVADLQRNYRVDYDTSGAIGRRYRRQDEVGTPYCITVDGQTIEDSTVTLRDRDSMQQIRIPANEISSEIARRLLA